MMVGQHSDGDMAPVELRQSGRSGDLRKDFGLSVRNAHVVAENLHSTAQEHGHPRADCSPK